MNQTHEERKRLGLCRSCGAKREDPSKSRCIKCRRKDSEASKARAARKRAAWEAEGLCPKCGAHREDPGRKNCAKCRGRAIKDEQRRRDTGKTSTRDRRRQAGLCVDCEADISNQESGIRCPVCQDLNALNRRERGAQKTVAGICVHCPEPAEPGKTLCVSCASKNTIRNATAKANRVADGVCRWCPSKATHESTACEYHFVYNLLKNWGRAPTSDEVDAVWTKLEDQNFECFYTGRPLVPGENASIEHLMPRKRYPNHVWTLDNIVWCDVVMNRLKGHMVPAEVLEFAQGIVARADKIAAADGFLFR